MDQHIYTITFDNGSVADANRWAGELQEYILDAVPDAQLEQQRDSPYSLDLGTTLSLVLAGCHGIWGPSARQDCNTKDEE